MLLYHEGSRGRITSRFGAQGDAFGRRCGEYNGDAGSGILIGGDHYWEIVFGKLERLSGSLVVLDSKYGWLIQETVCLMYPQKQKPTDVGTQLVSVGLEEQINHTLRSFRETESIGIIMERKSKKSDKEAMQFVCPV